ncbi:MAG: hypothetical protein ACFB14_16900 [Leptolyngbyaceae cyanobacterium]
MPDLIPTVMLLQPPEAPVRWSLARWERWPLGLGHLCKAVT